MARYCRAPPSHLRRRHFRLHRLERAQVAAVLFTFMPQLLDLRDTGAQRT